MTQPLFMLRIEIDGHFHGGRPIKPWVARLTGPDPKWGLAREFVRPLNDWDNARRAWSGNVYGVVSTFPLRDGHLYEVQRCEGNPSRRRIVRSFHALSDGDLADIEPDEALQRVSGGAPGALLKVREYPGGTLVTDLDDNAPVAFWISGRERYYWLRDGHTYDVRDVGRRDEPRCRIVRVIDGSLDIERVRSCPSATLSASNQQH